MNRSIFDDPLSEPDPRAMRARQARGRGRRGGGEYGPGMPPGFGPGGPAMGMAHMHPGPGFGRRARRGDVRSAVLSLLAAEPLNGYQIIKRIARTTGGAWRPSSGSVYPVLNQLATEGLIETAGDGPRTNYQLTEAGRAYVGEHADELAEAWDAATDESEAAAALRESFAKTMGAMRQLMFGASDEQAQAATSVLDETRRKLYQILAE